MSQVRPLAGERQKGESSKATQACNDYLRMGPGRSLRDLHRQYTETYQNQPPTESLATLKGWSTKYGWPDRAALWDAEAEERKNREYERAMETGLALAYKRVDRLRELAAFLRRQLYERGEEGVFHNVWVPDVKVVGRGDNAMTVDIEHFNSSLIREYRATLDDIAAETGGRKSSTDVNLSGEVKYENVGLDEEEQNRAAATLLEALASGVCGEGAGEEAGPVGASE